VDHRVNGRNRQHCLGYSEDIMEPLKMTAAEHVWVEQQLAETRKFIAEQNKLNAERQKSERVWWWVPFILVAGNIVLSALIGALVGHFVK
jgi:hypothetical protein